MSLHQQAKLNVNNRFKADTFDIQLNEKIVMQKLTQMLILMFEIQLKLVISGLVSDSGLRDS